MNKKEKEKKRNKWEGKWKDINGWEGKEELKNTFICLFLYFNFYDRIDSCSLLIFHQQLFFISPGSLYWWSWNVLALQLAS